MRRTSLGASRGLVMGCTIAKEKDAAGKGVRLLRRDIGRVGRYLWTIAVTLARVVGLGQSL